MNIQCIKCKNLKQIEEFSRNPSKKFGVNNICRECHSSYRKEYYIKNKDKEREKIDIYRTRYPEKYKHNYKSGRIFESFCPACNTVVFLTKKEKEDNFSRYCSKECRSTKNKSIYYLYLKGVEQRARKTGHFFDLSEEFIKDLLEEAQKNKCALSGIPIYIKDPRKDEITIYDSASIDRKKSAEGYTKDNIQWVALGINYMKLDRADNEALKLIELIRQ